MAQSDIVTKPGPWKAETQVVEATYALQKEKKKGFVTVKLIFRVGNKPNLLTEKLIITF